MTNLMEAYKKRLAVAESVYAKSHNGEQMSNTRKLITAVTLQNVNKFLSEAFENSTGTQRADMGLFRKFCLNLTNLAVPTLITPDLVMVHPMTSMSGYVAYLKITAGTNKGETEQGELINSPFQLGKVDRDYTSAAVAEKATAFSETIGSATVVFLQTAWFPVYNGDDAKSKLQVLDATTGTAVTVVIDEANSNFTTGKIAFTSGVTSGTEYRVKYVYNNVIIPQNDLPIVNAEMDSIPLIAKARRVAIYYSNLAAFQAKTDYGYDLGETLATQAVARLNYEIDSETVHLLAEGADQNDDAKSALTELTWSKTLPVGVNKADHFAGFAEILDQAGRIIYDRTRRFRPTYVIIASSILPVLRFVPGFTAAPASKVNGPYFAGTCDGLKVFVSPEFTDGEFVCGVNGEDLGTSAAVFAPYMVVTPTQLLGYADGGMSQGFSTLYDLKLLNPLLLVKGKVIA